MATKPSNRLRVAGLLGDFLDFALGQPHLYRFLVTDRRERARSYPQDFRAKEFSCLC